jgi:signal transduction histidine kinase
MTIDDGGPMGRIMNGIALVGRNSAEEVARESGLVRKSDLVKALLETSPGLFGVLDGKRQIIAVNRELLATFGIDDADAALGLRPGEVLSCSHADEGEDGCGTSAACAACGAIIAIVGGLVSSGPIEQRCSLRTASKGVEREYLLKVRANPLDIGGERYVLLFMEDRTEEERKAALERVFFHDVSNVVTALSSAAFLAGTPDPARRELGLKELSRLSQRLVREISLQRVLILGKKDGWKGEDEEIEHDALARELGDFGHNHPAGQGKEIVLPSFRPSRPMRTDYALLLRVLSNMLINALEASGEGERVDVEFEECSDHIVYSIRNAAVMPESVRHRIFERHFSTKGGSGRGMGTHSMKLLGEDYLGGRVGFETGAAFGTRFWIELPLRTAGGL